MIIQNKENTGNAVLCFQFPLKMVLYRILGRMQFKQSREYWLRYKNVIADETDLKWVLDFIEFVPVSVVDNDQYSEDWY